MQILTLLMPFLEGFLKPENITGMIEQGTLTKLFSDIIEKVSTMDTQKLAMVFIMFIQMQAQDSSIKKHAIDQLMILASKDRIIEEDLES